MYKQKKRCIYIKIKKKLMFVLFQIIDTVYKDKRIFYQFEPNLLIVRPPQSYLIKFFQTLQ